MFHLKVQQLSCTEFYLNILSATHSDTSNEIKLPVDCDFADYFVVIVSFASKCAHITTCLLFPFFFFLLNFVDRRAL